MKFGREHEVERQIGASEIILLSTLSSASIDSTPLDNRLIQFAGHPWVLLPDAS